MDRRKRLSEEETFYDCSDLKETFQTSGHKMKGKRGDVEETVGSAGPQDQGSLSDQVVDDGGGSVEKGLEDEKFSGEEEEIEGLGKVATMIKEEGNLAYSNGNFAGAEALYTDGLNICPKRLKKDRAILLSNRSVCFLKMNNIEAAVRDCSKALELHPTYVKALFRRAQLYEKIEMFEEAITDYERILQLDNSFHEALVAVLRLPREIELRDARQNSKELGNQSRHPSALSTENIQMQQDLDTTSRNGSDELTDKRA